MRCLLGDYKACTLTGCYAKKGTSLEIVMGPKTKELIAVLERLDILLFDHDAENWRLWIAKSKRRIKSSDYSGIEYLLSAYGGMGSFSDLVFGNDKDRFVQANDELLELRSKAYDIANEIRRLQ